MEQILLNIKLLTLTMYNLNVDVVYHKTLIFYMELGQPMHAHELSQFE